jgi:hypothetical protein
MRTAFPLAWPLGWPRTPLANRVPERGRGWTFNKAHARLLEEFERAGATRVTLSTNRPPRGWDGLPRGTRTGPHENDGIAVYLTLAGRELALGSDGHLGAVENMRAITLALPAAEALAGQLVGRPSTSG